MSFGVGEGKGGGVAGGKVWNKPTNHQRNGVEKRSHLKIRGCKGFVV